VIVVYLKVESILVKPVVGVNFYGEGGFMYCANSHYEGQSLGDNVDAGEYLVRITIPAFHLPHGSYTCSVVLAEEGPDNLIDWTDMASAFSVSRARDSRGSIKLPTDWMITKTGRSD
jgi:hypothetical protein